ncbi:hypothetical protein FXO37_23582 [Capsicum annuum]|nr:hypothetical protein FXO37_23582 [Capsicum annuum]
MVEICSPHVVRQKSSLSPKLLQLDFETALNLFNLVSPHHWTIEPLSQLTIHSWRDAIAIICQCCLLCVRLIRVVLLTVPVPTPTERKGEGGSPWLMLTPPPENTSVYKFYIPSKKGATSIASTSRANAPQPMAPAEKPRKFVGIDFKRWQQKMFFYLTTLCLQRFNSEDAPEVPEGTSDKERFIIVEAWKNSDFLCRNYILSGLQDDLYNVYSGTKTSKEL